MKSNVSGGRCLRPWIRHHGSGPEVTILVVGAPFPSSASIVRPTPESEGSTYRRLDLWNPDLSSRVLALIVMLASSSWTAQPVSPHLLSPALTSWKSAVTTSRAL